MKLELTDDDCDYICRLLKTRARHTHEIKATELLIKIDEQRRKQ